MFSRKWLTCIAGMVGLIAAQSASAYVECGIQVASIMSTDDGPIYIYWVGGGMGTLAAADPDQKTTIALATTALALGLPVTVRYADGSSCAGNFVAITGFQLNRG